MNVGNVNGPLPRVSALPENAILLHIGVHKTGTTAIQAALADSRVELRTHEVLYPGRRSAHHGAAMAILERPWGWKGKGGEFHDRGIFDKLAAQAAAFPRRVVISSEHFCETNDEMAAEVADAFGRERTHVVITLRNLGRLLPSSWQQYLKYGVAAPYETWLENTFETESKKTVSPSFWRRNDHGALVERWAGLVGADQVSVIVLEDVNRAAMFGSFAQLIDVPEEMFTSRMDLTANRSMTAGESELLRRLNKKIKPALEWNEYQRMVRVGIARTMVEDRTPEPNEPKLHTPDWALDAAAECGAAAVARIRESGVRVIGDVDALAVRVSSPPAVPAEILESVPMDVALNALETLIMLNRDQPTTKEMAKSLLRQFRSDASAKVKRKSKPGA